MAILGELAGNCKSFLGLGSDSEAHVNWGNPL
jgi:hypothetical protein